MDIHKPKAAHSLREFLIEIGTITVGILIALGLEAGVEAWHHQELVEHARADLRQELRDNRTSLVDALASERIAIAGLNRARDFTRRQLANQKVLPTDINLSVKSCTMRTAAWDSTVATQALAYMPFEDAQTLAAAYSASRAYNEFQQEARKPWFELSAAFASDGQSMTTAQLRDAQSEIVLSHTYLTTGVAAGDDLVKIYDRALKRLG